VDDGRQAAHLGGNSGQGKQEMNSNPGAQMSGNGSKHAHTLILSISGPVLTLQLPSQTLTHPFS